MEEGVRWNINVSKEIDITLRTYLGARGMKKGDLCSSSHSWRTNSVWVHGLSVNANPMPRRNVVDLYAVGRQQADRTNRAN
jgi:hypothetical protein